MLAESLTDLAASSNACKLLEDQKDFEFPGNSSSTRSQAVKDSLKQAIIGPNDLDVSFDNFPYYLRYYLIVLFCEMTC